MNEDLYVSHKPGTTISSVAIRYGLIIGFITIIYSLVLYLTDQSQNKVAGAVSYIILIAGIFLAHNQFKKENGGFMRYGQGLGIGSLISVIVGFLSGIFMYVYMKFIDPSFMEKIEEVQMQQMESRGMSEEEMEKAMAITSKLTSPEMMVVFAIIGTLIIGFLLSLIISAITKKTQPEYE